MEITLCKFIRTNRFLIGKILKSSTDEPLSCLYTQGQACNFCGPKKIAASLGSEIQSLPFEVGTVEYVVSGPYVTRPTPVQAVIIQALDLTWSGMKIYTCISDQPSIVWHSGFFFIDKWRLGQSRSWLVLIRYRPRMCWPMIGTFRLQQLKMTTNHG
jgi:hypothetical protein